MAIISHIFVAILFFLIALGIYMLYRNGQVYDIMVGIGDDIYKHNNTLIEKGTYDKEKIDYFDENLDRVVGRVYYSLFFKLWIPLTKAEEDLRINVGLKPRKKTK